MVVGLGRAGMIHVRGALDGSPLLALTAVADADAARAEDVAKAHAGVRPFASAQAALAADEKEDLFDAVVIATPTAHHVQDIQDSLRAGKPVMCEKPISFAVADIDSCYALAKEQKLPLLCAYQRRHDASFGAVARSAQAGEIGTLQVVRSTSRDNPVPTIDYLKISGKIFHDCGSHDIDMVRWVLGEDPIEVHAVGSAFNKDIAALGDWDTVVMTLTFPSGAIATIDLSRKAVYGYDQRLEVLGDDGMLQAENRQPTSVVRSTGAGISTDPHFFSFPQRYKETYFEELKHFGRVCRGSEAPMISHKDARSVAIIADAAERSCETKVSVKIEGLDVESS